MHTVSTCTSAPIVKGDGPATKPFYADDDDDDWSDDEEDED